MNESKVEAEFQVGHTLALAYTRYALIASMSIVILEYFELFALEKLLIWKSKWTVSKFLFLASRYLPFGFVTIYVYYNSAPLSTSPQACHGMYGFATATMIIAGLCADAVLYLRLYAVSKQGKMIKIVLIVNFVVVSTMCILGAALFLQSETYIPSPNLLPSTTCFHRGSRQTTLWLTVCYGSMLYSSLFTTTLSLWYGVRLYLTMRPMRPTMLIKIFHRDGAIYFVCIATVALANAFLALFAPLQYRYLLAGTQGVVHSILAARMILHLREAAQNTVIQSSSAARNPMVGDAWGTSWSIAKPLSEFRAAPNSTRVDE